MKLLRSSIGQNCTSQGVKMKVFTSFDKWYSMRYENGPPTDGNLALSDILYVIRYVKV